MTIKDLAAISGYAVGTVSRVLNNCPNVSEKAREKILAVAHEQGFEFNINAKNLKQTHSNNVVVVVRGVHNVLFSAMVEQLQVLAARSPYRLVVDYVDEQADEVRQALKRIRELKPQGVLFLGGCSAHFRESFANVAIPAVLVTNAADDLGFDNLSSVTTDDEAAAADAIGYLLDMGHREIAVIGGSLDDSDTSHLRYMGCRRAFAERGLFFDEKRHFRAARYSYADGYAAMAETLKESPEITAVFAMSDTMAIGAARAIRDAGKTIPGDISLIGFDGLPICGFYHPRIATITQQTDYMAQKSFSILCEAIEHKCGAQHLLAPYTLEQNGSVLALKKES